MEDVRYIFGDALTSEVVAEVSLQGVSVSSTLDGGDFRGTLHLDQTGMRDDVLVSATVPGRSYVVVERGDVPIWGGLIWTRTYQSQSKSIQLYGKDLKSYPERRFVLVDKPFQSAEQTSQFLALYAEMQADPNSVIVQLPAAKATGIIRSLELTASEFKTYRSVLDSVADNDDGFDWIIHWSRTGGAYEKRMEIGFPHVGSEVDHGTVTFDYYDVAGRSDGGNILNYWQNDTMAGSGTHIFGLGGGEGDLMLRSNIVHTSLLGGGFPRYDVDVAMKDIMTQSVLDSLVYQQALLRRAPAGVMTLEVKGDGKPAFGDYAIGDVCRISIKDPLHPHGLLITKRLLGYEWYPPSNDSVEYARLVFEGEELQ